MQVLNIQTRNVINLTTIKAIISVISVHQNQPQFTICEVTYLRPKTLVLVILISQQKFPANDCRVQLKNNMSLDNSLTFHTTKTSLKTKFLNGS